MTPLYYQLGFLFIFLISAIQIVLVLHSKEKSNLSFIWVIVNSLTLIWSIFQVSYLNISNQIISLLFDKTAIFISLLFAFTFSYLCIRLINKKYRNNIIPIIFSIIIAIFSYFLFLTNKIVKEVNPRYNLKNYIVPGDYYLIYLMLFIIIFSYGFIILTLNYKKQKRDTKKIIKYFLTGSIFTTIGISIIFISVFTNFNPIFGIYLLPTYSYFITYSLIKHNKLLDIEIIFTKTALVALTYVPIMIIPYLIAIFYKNFLITYLGLMWWIVPLIISSIIGVIWPFIYIYLNEHLFQNLVTEVENYKNKIEIDPETNFYKCVYYKDKIDRELTNYKHIKSKQTVAAVYIIDIDHFDMKINIHGDKIKKEIIKIIKNTLDQIKSKEIFIGRLSKKRFSIFIQTQDNKLINNLAEKIRTDIENSIIKINKKEVQITVSIGICKFPKCGKYAIELFNKAEKALEIAKKTGRNKIEFYSK